MQSSLTEIPTYLYVDFLANTSVPAALLVPCVFFVIVCTDMTDHRHVTKLSMSIERASDIPGHM